MRGRPGLVGVLILIILAKGSFLWRAAAFEAEDLLFGYGTKGWQAGLGLSQENIKPLGFFGYEKTGIAGFLSHSNDEDELSSWFSGHKQVYLGNVGYTLELFVANIQRPILSTFLNDVNPHVGAYGEYNRSHGEFGHGLSGQALLFLSESGEVEYSVSPFIQLSKTGTWRFSASLGSTLGFGISYLEPSESLKLDASFTGDQKLRIHALISLPDLPLSLGAGWSDQKMQGFIRYYF
ncbi:MAG: hypothetical protein GX335_10745 [Firmicutes bacterium]|nr:hypothetical protein [Bacillota bacterium]